MIRTEYGAQLPDGVIYLHGFNAPTVQSFVTEYGNGLHLVTRQWVGDVHGRWEAAA